MRKMLPSGVFERATDFLTPQETWKSFKHRILNTPEIQFEIRVLDLLMVFVCRNSRLQLPLLKPAQTKTKTAE